MLYDRTLWAIDRRRAESSRKIAENSWKYSGKWKKLKIFYVLGDTEDVPSNHRNSQRNWTFGRRRKAFMAERSNTYWSVLSIFSRIHPLRMWVKWLWSSTKDLHSRWKDWIGRPISTDIVDFWTWRSFAFICWWHDDRRDGALVWYYFLWIF